MSLVDRLTTGSSLWANRASDPCNGPLTISATEGWAPNLPIATASLSPLGIEVREYDSDRGMPMPWPNETFDVVMNRHESFDPEELSRVIRPGGRFLTQQVDGTEAQEFREWFGGEPMYPEAQLEPASAGLLAQGFTITEARTWSGTMRFNDVEAVLEYLGYVPWDVPGFTVEANFDTLEKLARLESPIEVTQKRFLIIADKQ
ncbi:hypothetical protein DFO66_11674 [Brevibacterium sanguinis]|uniref:Methyltransferase family protein n=3 Tax=Brevibacteriaceae TaxID=85019 RepID=A0A366IIS1_9MICO|nr:hypothetical protein DFO66_11674 [Brevibacterium sanguinis]RBP70610.1 hypothetical protein DFO65_10862 [Brevibacterium celere]